MTLVGQLGCSRYRIDLAAVHPQQPGRFVLAIECDGASYHSAPTARDRDRLRQQQLEALGWRFHRIWSTDWFLRREDEVERAIRALEDAVAWADRNPDVVAPVDGGVVVDAVGDQMPTVRIRTPRPAVPRGDSIDDYTSDDLMAMVRWVRSDGRLHTNEEIVREVGRALGFKRMGRRIVEAVERAIADEKTDS